MADSFLQATLLLSGDVCMQQRFEKRERSLCSHRRRSDTCRSERVGIHSVSKTEELDSGPERNGLWTIRRALTEYVLSPERRVVVSLLMEHGLRAFYQLPNRPFPFGL